MSGMVMEKTERDTFVQKALFESFTKVILVNINTGEFEVYKDEGILGDDGLNEMPDIYAYMRKLITDEYIYPEYATVCRRFTNPEYVRKSVFSGERRIVQSYRCRTATGHKWITFAIIVGSDCAPDNPMVLFTWREADSDAITLLDTLPTISSLYDKLIRINLSNNTFEPVIVDADEQERLVGGVINMYEWWAGYSKDGNIASEDMGAFGTLTRTGSLQKRFAEDPTPVSFRYRRKVNDDYRWVQLQIAPSVEYSDDNQIMLLSLKDVHEEYTEQIRSRQRLIDNMNRDALTRLFNRLKFNEDIEALKKSEQPLFTCLYIDVNGLHELNNLLGHQKGDDMLCCVADTLKAHFPDERVYRIGGDEFVAVSTRMSKQDVERKIENVRRDLIRDNYEISVGVESGAGGADVDRVVAAAEQRMRDDKTAYYTRSGHDRRKRQMNEELEQMLTEKRDNERFLDIITHMFTGVYFVDLTHDSARHIYAPEYFLDYLKRTDACFSAAVQIYIEQHVVPEDRDLLREALNFEKIGEKLGGNGNVDIDYRKTDGNEMTMRILPLGRRQNEKAETLWMFWKKQR